MSALKVRHRLGSVLDEVIDTDEPLVVTRGDLPVVVVLSYPKYSALLASVSKRRASRLRGVARHLREWGEQNQAALAELQAVAAIRRIPPRSDLMTTVSVTTSHSCSYRSYAPD
jgi:prevent-host-death family protein